MKNLTVVNNDDKEYFIMEENKEGAPSLLGRIDSIEKLLEVINDNTNDIKIKYDPYFGDYISKALSKDT